MQEQHSPVKKRVRPKAIHIVFYVVALLILIASTLAFLAAVIGWSGHIFGELDAMEPGQELIPGGYAFAFMSLVFVWIFLIFIMAVLLAVCWTIGLIVTIILAFFLKNKPIWLSILSYLLFAVYVILVLCILVPVVPFVLILLFLLIFD
jgi:hypothetical protein